MLRTYWTLLQEETWHFLRQYVLLWSIQGTFKMNQVMMRKYTFKYMHFENVTDCYETTYKGWSLVLKIFVCPLGFWSPTLNEPQVRPDQHYVCSIISDQVRSNSVAVGLSFCVSGSEWICYQLWSQGASKWLRGKSDFTLNLKVRVRWKLVHQMCPSTTTEGKKGLTVNWRVWGVRTQ